MYVKDSDSRERLIEAGKAEFLEYGFKQASLRRICTRANLTTGAVYSCFDGKEGLFHCIVSETAERLKESMQANYHNECEDASLTLDNDIRLMKFLWENKEAVMILLEGSEGTSYENMYRYVEASMVQYFSGFYKEHTKKDIDKELVGVLVKSRLKGIVEVLKGEYSLHKSLELAEKLSIYSNTGYQKLMEMAGSSL